MKKFLSLLAIAAMLLFTACGDDEPDNITVKSNINGLIVKTISGGHNINISSCDISYEYGNNPRHMDLGINNVSFAPRMPRISFEVNGLDAVTNDGIGFWFSGYNIQVMSGYTLDDIEGKLDKNLNTLILTYAVKSEQGQYDVITFSPILYSVLSNGSSSFDYENATEKFYKFKSQIDDNNNFTASICIDNIQFVSQMPKLEEILIPLDDATIVQTANGYTATAETIVPYFKQGDKYIPFSDRTISNLEYTLDIKGNQFSIEFDCFGLHYTDEGHIYSTHFNPFAI
ncbi:MAG: hypothetical protein J5523_00365 [Muribaculaceae bacterium]|nr:hypothetical protein [Muribaculaceae bacterium]